ncbi:MAG TPA: histidine--tRNA ligase [Candidatus Avacidaminococcus intestinavium]|uniref:Histidine--tRNA ligase n=1 Tax=Candidatus Avacidaminococcus intestinavium TaxID=2840684 RepID=A0A9D1MQT6_9FIRM|nr:histidine--tRNA ligase [Candidatus Avacidaminococcus intestinavium]
MNISAPRGTKDILPQEIKKWHYVEDVMRSVCADFAYQEIRTPIFEHTELFQRGIGDTTDVVEKEMYTFCDRGGRSITLRPENTAAVVRSYIENKLYADGGVSKLFYLGPMFRYDRPQAGRLRQFNQFGVEVLATSEPLIDAEIISLAYHILQKLGLKDLKLLINSVGCPKCRPQHKEKLKEFFKPKLQQLCTDCQSRYDRNPLRILDCKVEKCKTLSVGAPSLAECLCEECRAHFTAVKEYLEEISIPYELDDGLVRGLDYYTKTAFEIQYSPLGAQSAVCGGGRYDGLVQEIGGPQTAGIGFAMGIERILLALEKQNLLPETSEQVDVFIVVPDQENRKLGFKIAYELRKKGISTVIDSIPRSMKAQLKQANKLQAEKVLLLGAEELSRQKVVLKDMLKSEQQEIAIENIALILAKTGVQKNG